MRLRRPFIYKIRKNLVQTIYQQTCFVFQSRVVLRTSLSFSSIYLFPGVSCSLVAVVLVFVFAFSEAFSVRSSGDSPPYF